MSLPVTSGTTQPTVTTSFADYAPGETAGITASGFEAGVTIEFQVLHVSGAGPDGILGTLDDELEASDGDGHDIWSVTDGGAGDLDGIANGVIQTSWYVNPDDSLDATFLLSAIGSNGQIATNTFTDAAGSVSKVYQHWADGDSIAADWNNNILSDAKSNYFEGEVVPHVFVYTASKNTPLTNGQTYSFTITYNNYQLNSNAGGFDYITTYNLNRDPGYFVATTAVMLPTADSTFTNGGGMQGTFYTVDADITAVSDAVLSGSGNEDRKVTVSFIYTGSTTTNGLAEIFFGLAIAQPGDVKSITSNGASAWTGGSLQTTIDIGGSGATSIQLAPSAIIKGNISGYKFEDINGDRVWDSASGEKGLSGWTIYIDKNRDGVFDVGEESTVTAADGSYSFSVIPDSNTSTPEIDSYLIREVAQNGWKQTTFDPAAIEISAADPTETNVNFGNQKIISSLAITKDASVPGSTADTAGEIITYTYVVTNTGNAAIADVNVRDDNATPDDASDDFDATYASGDDNDNHLLDTSETWSYSSMRTVTQAMLDNGSDLTNIATATGTDAASDTDDATVDVVQNKQLHIEKDASVPGSTADTAGEIITYTYVVTNTGNAAIADVNVRDDNATPDDASDDFDATYASGDDNDNHLLDTSETWSYSSMRTVTQAMLDNGSDLTNIATATGTDAASDTDDATVDVVQNKQLDIDKITIIGPQSGDGLTNVAVGAAVTWQYTVTNTGNVSLSTVAVEDDHGTISITDDFFATYYSGDTGGDKIMSPGEKWIFTATGTTVAGNYSNIGTVTALDPNAKPVTDTDVSSYSATAKDYGLIAPTSTTVSQYISGTASTFEAYYASQGGVVQYGVKGGLIGQTNPGVFFYFTGLSGGLKAADVNTDSVADKMTIFVDQSDTSPTIGAFMPTFSDVRLYKITDLDGNGIDAGDTITSVNLTKSQVTITSGGDVTINFTPDQIDSMYVVSIKYSTGSVINSNVGTQAAFWPTVDYSFVTNVGGIALAGENGEIALAPKVKALMLDGEIGAGARAVNDAQLDHVINQALKYWAAHGATADDINMLKATDVTTSDLGGKILSMTDGTSITIDDDADGHGWSLGLGSVAAQKVDLFSALVHEMGHLLGYEHDVLGEDLAVGERIMPLSSDDDGHGVPDFIGSVPPVVLVGVPEEQQFHFA